MDFAPDGRLFVIEKRGVLKVVRPGENVARVVLDLSSRVNTVVDRGLTGVAVDANFAANRYVYLLYTYEPPAGGQATGPRTARLTRIQVNPDDTLVNPSNPETVILGKYNPSLLAPACPAPGPTVDCIPADGISHVQGTVRAAPDGTLFVGTGDAVLSATNRPDPYRPLNVDSLAGKILHIDRNGRGVPGHGFCPANADLTQACTKVFAMGFRNPFRFDFASRGGLWVGDVGEARYEELDHVVRGASYGWPCYEGPEPHPARAGAAPCQPLFAAEGTSSAQRDPVFSYAHVEGQGAVILGGPEYQGDRYPAEFRGSVFFGDIDRGFLDRVDIPADGGEPTRHQFATEYGGVDMRIGPDGLLYTANFFNVSRYVPVAGNRTPVARATAVPDAGPAPLQVAFDGRASSDPDGDALAYAWEFGDGSTGEGAQVAHTYAAGDYTARLTVTDPAGASHSATLRIRSGVQPPTLEVSGPSTYRNGEAVTLTATARDDAGTDISGSVRWAVGLRHNDHAHDFGRQDGSTATFTPLRDHDTDSHYDVTVSVTDRFDLTTTRTLRLDGETAPVDLLVVPAGSAGGVTFGGVEAPWPVQRRSVIGFRTTLAASANVVAPDGRTLPFANWSDGGAIGHEVTVPAAGLSLTATYSDDATPPQTTFVNPATVFVTPNPRFEWRASEPSTFECRIDGRMWVACNSPITLPKQSKGEHVFEVRATDMAGNVEPIPARVEFRIV